MCWHGMDTSEPPIEFFTIRLVYCKKTYIGFSKVSIFLETTIFPFEYILQETE